MAGGQWVNEPERIRMRSKMISIASQALVEWRSLQSLMALVARFHCALLNLIAVESCRGRQSNLYFLL